MKILQRLKWKFQRMKIRMSHYGTIRINVNKNDEIILLYIKKLLDSKDIDVEMRNGELVVYFIYKTSIIIAGDSKLIITTKTTYRELGISNLCFDRIHDMVKQYKINKINKIDRKINILKNKVIEDIINFEIDK